MDFLMAIYYYDSELQQHIILCNYKLQLVGFRDRQ